QNRVRLKNKICCSFHFLPTLVRKDGFTVVLFRQHDGVGGHLERGRVRVSGLTLVCVSRSASHESPVRVAAMFYSHLLLAVYILTFLMGVPANMLSFVTFCRKVRRKAAPIDVLLLNLTISDLIFLAFLPFKMKEAYDHMNWLMPYALCPLTGFLFYVTIYNSTLLLTAVSVERYLGVAFPLRYSACRRPCYAVWACIAFWVVTSSNLCFVYILPYAQWTGGGSFYSSNVSGPSPPPPTCYLNFSDGELQILMPIRLELFLVLFCIPFIISCFCYVNFILILSRLPHITRRRRLRCIGLALGTLIVFTVCFGPYNVSHVVGFAYMESHDWRNLALLSSTLNACLDPFIFYLSSAAVRSMMNRCFRRVTTKMHILRCRRASQSPQHKLPTRENHEADAPP
ncbi:free fatty acid receptor 3-like, partial [Nothobranchius furzeri]